MSKVAILQMADAGPAESTALMLRCAGYDVYLPDKKLRDELRRVGCDTVLSPRDLTRGMGYDPVDIPEIGTEGMNRCDLYCDVKGHRNYERVVRRWSRLANRVLWVRINGGRPEHVVNERGDHGDEVNPPCPVLTPNLWYAEDGPWRDRSYACWPPFVRFGEYYDKWGRADNRTAFVYRPPVCLIHNVGGWGYGPLVSPLRQLGVRVYGNGSPDGLLPHEIIPQKLSAALCVVHLKSSDAPGYAILESLAAACPVVCTRRLIWRCKMESLLVPGETCLVFDRETHDALTADDVHSCTTEVAAHLDRLRDPAENRRVGEAGRSRLQSVMWNEARDGDSFRRFMGRCFPQ
jgi:hypothetical protein